MNNVKLRLALASALEMETKDMEDFLEPPLSLCRAFLPTVTWEQERSQLKLHKRANAFIRGIFYMRGRSRRMHKRQKRDIAYFGSNIGLFLDLAASREATTGFLTTLPKISFTTILEMWRQEEEHGATIIGIE